MDRQLVSSSNLLSVGYDETSSILEVEFRDRAVYQYGSVPRSIYEGLMAARSKGAYLDRYVKGRYDYWRVR